MIVADTDVLVDYLRGMSPIADRVAAEINRGLATTAVTAFELWSGSLGSERRWRAVEALLAAVKILPLDAGSAREAASVRHELQERGTPIGMADSLIAGICRSNSAALLSRNRKHFERVPGLALVSD